MIDVRDPGEGMPDGFLALPSQVYADDGQWIPEDAEAVARAFSPDNPWFRQGRARLYAAPGRGRLALFFQPELRVEGRTVAFFGYWESIGDAEADALLLEQAMDQARAWGAQALYGPINFTTFGTYRLRLSAEPGAWTFPGEPYNPPRYGPALESLGFALDQTYLTQVASMETCRMLREGKRPLQEKLLSQGYRIDTLTPGIWMDALDELHGLVDHIFGENFAYSPLSYDAFVAACGASFIERACPDTSVIAWGPEGDIAGFFLVYPHYGPLVVQAAGERRVATGTLRHADHAALLAEHGRRACVAKTVGVAPAHQSNGVMGALSVSLLDRGDGRYDHWLGAMIRRGNRSQNFAAGTTAGERWYGLYRREL